MGEEGRCERKQSGFRKVVWRERKEREGECVLAYFITEKPIYIEFELKEREDKVRNKGEDR